MKIDKARIELIITLGFSVILIFVISKNITGAKQKAGAPAQGPAAPALSNTAQKTTLVGQNQNNEDRINKIKASGWVRDPFVFGKSNVVVGGLILNGIVWDETSPSAIVNNKIVMVGDEIDGNNIVEIQRDKVVLSKDSNILELDLQPGSRQ